MNSSIARKTKKSRGHSEVLSRISDNNTLISTPALRRAASSWFNNVSPIDQNSSLDRHTVLQGKNSLKNIKKKGIVTSTPGESRRLSLNYAVSPSNRKEAGLLQNENNSNSPKKKKKTGKDRVGIDDNCDRENEKENVEMDNSLLKSLDLKHRRRGFFTPRGSAQEEINDSTDSQEETIPENDDEEDVLLHGLRKTVNFPPGDRENRLSIGPPRVQLTNFEYEEPIVREKSPIVSVIFDDKIHESLLIADDEESQESEVSFIDEDGDNEESIYDDESYELSPTLPQILKKAQAPKKKGPRHAKFENEYNKLKRAISPPRSAPGCSTLHHYVDDKRIDDMFEKLKRQYPPISTNYLQKTIRKKKTVSEFLNLGFLSRNDLYRDPIPENIDLILQGYYDETNESEVFNFPGRNKKKSRENDVNIQKNTRRKFKKNVPVLVDSDDETLRMEFRKRVIKPRAGPSSKVKYRRKKSSPWNYSSPAWNSDSSEYCFTGDEMKINEPIKSLLDDSTSLFQSSFDSDVEISKKPSQTSKLLLNPLKRKKQHVVFSDEYEKATKIKKHSHNTSEINQSIKTTGSQNLSNSQDKTKGPTIRSCEEVQIDLSKFKGMTRRNKTFN